MRLVKLDEINYGNWELGIGHRAWAKQVMGQTGHGAWAKQVMGHGALLLLPSSFFLLPSSFDTLPTANCQLPTANCQLT
jgi:hypothetical protein